jgi:membrane protease YdiL (CAAX protease family)
VADEGGAVRAERWGLGDVAFAVMAGLFGATIFAGGWAAATGAGPTDLSSDLAGLAGEWLGVVVVLVFASRTKGTGDLATDYGLRFDLPRDLILGVAVGALSQVVLSYAVTPIVEHFQRHLKLSEHAIDVGNKAATSSSGTKVVVAAVFVIGAPVIEELFFRGALQRALTRRFGAVAAVAVSAIVFALPHLQGNVSLGSKVTLVAELATFGVVLSVLAHRTGRLGPGIFAHAAFNAVATYSLLHL